MAEPPAPLSSAAISVRTDEAEKLGPVIATIHGDPSRERGRAFLGAALVAGLGLVFAAAAVGPPFAWSNILCGVLGSLSFALGVGGFVRAAGFSKLAVEFREDGVRFIRGRGDASFSYSSITSVRLLDGWHKKLKRRTRWLEVHSAEQPRTVEVVALDYSDDDFDAIVDELGKHATLTG